MPLNLDFGKLDNLQELEHLNRLDHLEKMDNLKNLDKLQELDKLQDLHSLQNFQNLDKLSNLDKLQDLSQLQQLNQLQQLELLKKLQHMDELGKLQHLEVLKNLDRLDQMNQLSNLRELRLLNKLEYMGHFDKLQSLNKLDKLDSLNHLSFIDRVMNMNPNVFLYVASFIVPGLVFREAMLLFMDGHNRLLASILMVIIYNILHLMLCSLFLYDYLTWDLLRLQPVLYYSIWIIILLIVPFLLGWAVAMFLQRQTIHRFLQTKIFKQPIASMANVWERFFSNAETYSLTITLNNEQKLMGLFKSGAAMPQTADTEDLYILETSHYNSREDRWEALQDPVETWIKGSEIKMIEASRLQ